MVIRGDVSSYELMNAVKAFQERQMGLTHEIPKNKTSITEGSSYSAFKETPHTRTNLCTVGFEGV